MATERKTMALNGVPGPVLGDEERSDGVYRIIPLIICLLIFFKLPLRVLIEIMCSTSKARHGAL